LGEVTYFPFPGSHIREGVQYALKVYKQHISFFALQTFSNDIRKIMAESGRPFADVRDEYLPTQFREAYKAYPGKELDLQALYEAVESTLAKMFNTRRLRKERKAVQPTDRVVPKREKKPRIRTLANGQRVIKQ
jgi:hypothetical protein